MLALKGGPKVWDQAYNIAMEEEVQFCETNSHTEITNKPFFLSILYPGHSLGHSGKASFYPRGPWCREGFESKVSIKFYSRRPAVRSASQFPYSSFRSPDNYMYPTVFRGPMSCQKAKKELGFTPTPMDVAFRETIQW